jgi:rubrerythrin
MGDTFAGSEIVELGIQIEKNGRDFYNILIGQSKNQPAKEVFKYLAVEEEKHLVVFQKILDSVHKYQPIESYPAEYFAYMNALASEYIFTRKSKGKEIAQKTKSDIQAIGLGIGFEKDSIIFYEGMKQVVRKVEREVINELIRQEQRHLQKLIDLKRNLK